MNYRNLARQALTRAQALLASEEDGSLRYGALELRLCMEALTYDRAQAYKSEIPPEEMDKWQPRKLMKVLLDIVPDADKSYSLRVGQEPYPGGQPEKMHALGTDTVLSMADLKASYDAIGSMLHMPTMKQVESGKMLNNERMRDRCQRAINALDNSLASPVWNFTMGKFATCDCVECGKPVRRRLPVGAEKITAECFYCHALYDLRPQEDGGIMFEPRMRDVDCPTEGCDARFSLWTHEIKEGAHWRCQKCDKAYAIVYGVAPLPEP